MYPCTENDTQLTDSSLLAQALPLTMTTVELIGYRLSRQDMDVTPLRPLSEALHELLCVSPERPGRGTGRVTPRSAITATTPAWGNLAGARAHQSEGKRVQAAEQKMVGPGVLKVSPTSSKSSGMVSPGGTTPKTPRSGGFKVAGGYPVPRADEHGRRGVVPVKNDVWEQHPQAWGRPREVSDGGSRSPLTSPGGLLNKARTPPKQRKRSPTPPRSTVRTGVLTAKVHKGKAVPTVELSSTTGSSGVVRVDATQARSNERPLLRRRPGAGVARRSPPPRDTTGLIMAKGGRKAPPPRGASSTTPHRPGAKTEQKHEHVTNHEAQSRVATCDRPMNAPLTMMAGSGKNGNRTSADTILAALHEKLRRTTAEDVGGQPPSVDESTASPSPAIAAWAHTRRRPDPHSPADCSPAVSRKVDVASITSRPSAATANQGDVATEHAAEGRYVYKNLVNMCTEELLSTEPAPGRQLQKDSTASPKQSSGYALGDATAWEDNLVDILKQHGHKPRPTRSPPSMDTAISGGGLPVPDTPRSFKGLLSPSRWRRSTRKTPLTSPRASSNNAPPKSPSTFSMLCGAKTPTLSEGEESDSEERSGSGHRETRRSSQGSGQQRKTPPASPRRSGGFMSGFSNKLGAALSMLSPRRTPVSSPLATPSRSPVPSPRREPADVCSEILEQVALQPLPAAECEAPEFVTSITTTKMQIRRSSAAGSFMDQTLDSRDWDDFGMMVDLPLPPSTTGLEDKPGTRTPLRSPKASKARTPQHSPRPVFDVGADVDIFFDPDTGAAAACVVDGPGVRRSSDGSESSQFASVTNDTTQSFDCSRECHKEIAAAIDDEDGIVACGGVLDSGDEGCDQANRAWKWELEATAGDITQVFEDCCGEMPETSASDTPEVETEVELPSAPAPPVSPPVHLIRSIAPPEGQFATPVRLCLQLPGSPASPSTPCSVFTPIAESTRYSSAIGLAHRTGVDQIGDDSLECSVGFAPLPHCFVGADVCVLLGRVDTIAGWQDAKAKIERDEQHPAGLGLGCRRRSERRVSVFPVSLVGIGSELLRAAGWWLSWPESDTIFLQSVEELGRDVLFAWTLVQLHDAGLSREHDDGPSAPISYRKAIPALVQRLPHLLLLSGFAAKVRDAVLAAALSQWRDRLRAGSGRGVGHIGIAIQSDTPLHRFPIVIPAAGLPDGPLSPVSPAVLARWRSRSGRGEEPLLSPLPGGTSLSRVTSSVTNRTHYDRRLNDGAWTARSAKPTPRPGATPRSGGAGAKTPRQLFKGFSKAFRKKPTNLPGKPSGTLNPVADPFVRSPHHPSPRTAAYPPGHCPIFEPFVPRSPRPLAQPRDSPSRHTPPHSAKSSYLGRNELAHDGSWMGSSAATSAASSVAQGPTSTGHDTADLLVCVTAVNEGQKHNGLGVTGKPYETTVDPHTKRGGFTQWAGHHPPSRSPNRAQHTPAPPNEAADAGEITLV
jgi:hypothetical protein